MPCTAAARVPGTANRSSLLYPHSVASVSVGIPCSTVSSPRLRSASDELLQRNARRPCWPQRHLWRIVCRWPRHVHLSPQSCPALSQSISLNSLHGSHPSLNTPVRSGKKLKKRTRQASSLADLLALADGAAADLPSPLPTRCIRRVTDGGNLPDRSIPTVRIQRRHKGICVGPVGLCWNTFPHFTPVLQAGHIHHSEKMEPSDRKGRITTPAPSCPSLRSRRS